MRDFWVLISALLAFMIASFFSVNLLFIFKILDAFFLEKIWDSEKKGEILSIAFVIVWLLLFILSWSCIF